MPDPVARTEGPNKISNLISQRARWQRVLLETTWHYRRMVLNPRYKAVGFVGIPIFLVSEVVAPFVELVALLTLLPAVVLGMMSWPEYALVLGIMSFANATLSVAAISLEDAGTRSYRRMTDRYRHLLEGQRELAAQRLDVFLTGARTGAHEPQLHMVEPKEASLQNR